MVCKRPPIPIFFAKSLAKSRFQPNSSDVEVFKLAFIGHTLAKLKTNLCNPLVAP